MQKVRRRERGINRGVEVMGGASGTGRSPRVALLAVVLIQHRKGDDKVSLIAALGPDLSNLHLSLE